MFMIECHEAKIGLREQAELDHIIDNMEAASYQSALRSMLDGLCRAAGLERSDISLLQVVSGRAYYLRRRQSDSPLGDLLFGAKHCFLLQPSPEKLQVWSIRHHTVESATESFWQALCHSTQKSLDGRRLRGMDFTWRAVPVLTSRPRPGVGRELYAADSTLENLGLQPSFTQQEVEASRLLTDSETRTFLLRLAQVTKARAVDTDELQPTKAESLLQVGIIRQEYLITCRQDSHTICTLQTLELVEQQATQFKCPVCGRAFKDELQQEIYVLTDSGRAILQNSRWMSIWITDCLLDSGVSLDQIRWGLETNGEELDIMLELWGLRVFFELKDREFGLGDAYPFAYRVSRYGGDWGVIVTMDKVAADAKKFLKEQRGPIRATMKLIEGQRNIPRETARLVDDLSRSAILRLVSSFVEDSGIDLQPIMEKWLEFQATRT